MVQLGRVLHETMKAVVSLGVLLCVGVYGDENASSRYAADHVLFPPFVDNTAPNCSRDLKEFYKGMISGKEWALKMYDSTEKFPTGLLLGRTTAPGQFEECLSVVHPNFTGQHCTINLIVANSMSEQIPGLEKRKPTRGRSQNMLQRMVNKDFGYGVCVPSTCNTSDLQAMLKFMGLAESLAGEITEDDCFKTPYQKLRVRDYLAITCLSFVVLLALVSTAWDLYCAEGKENVVLKSFSLRTNLKSLFKVNHKTSNYDSLNGLRVLSMLWIIHGHYFYNDHLLGEYNNNIHSGTVVNEIAYIVQVNAYPSVDTFFFLSGLLVCLVFFREITQKGGYDFPLTVLRRYIRLSVPLAVAVLFQATLCSRVNSGPFSKVELRSMEQACENTWWTFFLYINNFSNESRECIPQAWYLGADMQMYLISPLVTFVLFFWPKFSRLYLSLLVLLATLVDFMACYAADLPAFYTIDLIQGLLNLEYYYFYTRMAPWLVGIITCCFLLGVQSKKITFKPSKVWLTIGWLTSAFLLLSTLYGAAAFLPINTVHSTLERSSYRTFSKLSWALGLSWIVVACSEGYGGFVNGFLSLEIFQPLAKLSYCMYLTHHAVQKYRFYHFSRRSQISDTHAMMYSFLSDVVVTIIVSIPMTLIYEMPVARMVKILLKDVKIFPYPRVASEKQKQFDLENGVNKT